MKEKMTPTVDQIEHKHSLRKARVGPDSCARFIASTFGVGLICFGSLLLSVAAQAATVTLTPAAPKNYWAGQNTTNNLPGNSIAVAETGGGPTTNINLSISGTNGTTVFGTLTPSTFTNNGTSVLAISASNAVNGFYPLSVIASGDAAATNNFNLFVVPQWKSQAVGSNGNWSDDANWTGGSQPLSTDGVYIDHSTVGPWTNVVDGTRTIQSLVYLGDADEGASAALAVNTTIASGETLSVLGTNGFFVGKRTRSNTRPVYTFQGGNLLVSNAVADFAILDANNNSTRYTRVNMSGLDNLNIDVNRVAIADVTASSNGPDGSTLVDFVLAKTNVIRATLTDDYNKSTFNTSISYMRQNQAANNAQSANAQFRLGTTNAFYADSLGIGLGDAVGSGSSAFSSTIGYRMVFASPNNAAPTSSARFRNTDGVSRMSLLALGVDQGLNTQIANNRGIMDLQGGRVDMLVNQIWLGQDRTNSANANVKDSIGGLYFNWGTIDCNTLIAGRMKYTNNVGGAGLKGYVIVGTNGTLVVNTNLVLGETPAVVTGFEAQAALVAGQIRIDNGGTIRAQQISVGQFSAGNEITVNGGGKLEVSNTVASATTALGKLTVNSGGTLVLHKNGANTRVYVTNLVASGGIIDIGSVTGVGSFAPLISYLDASGESASFVAGNVPGGYNATIFNNTVTHTIDLTLTTGTPKTLLWKGYVNNEWNNTTPNWLDMNTGLHTNFATGDSAVFDDSASFFSVNVTEDVVPRQSTGFDGMTMTNNINAYTFTGTDGIRGAASFVKYGTSSVALNVYSEIAVTVNEGLLTGSGTIGSATVNSGGACSWLGGGIVLGKIINAGSLTNAGTINNGLTLTGGTAINSGTVIGLLTMQTNSYLYNTAAGQLTSIGSPTVQTNAILVNDGVIKGQNLDINGSLYDSGIGSIQVSVGTLTVNGGGSFIPGGSGIGTTTVKETSLSDPLAAGAVKFLTGSTIQLKVNLTNAQTNTKVLANHHVFGPNHGLPKAFDGCTLRITNIGPTAFAAGQSFKFFGSVIPPDGNILDLGLNTTNSLPVMDPLFPGPGLAWDLSNLIPGGYVSITNASVTEVLYAMTVGGQLISFTSGASGTLLASIAVTGLEANETIVGMDFRGTDLFGVGSHSRLYTINRATGAATLVGAFTPILNGLSFGVDAEPDGIRVVSDLKQNLLLDYATGAATSFPDLSGSPAPFVTGLARSPGNGVIYVADSDANTIGRLNPGTGLVTTIGPTTIDFSRNNGFDISSQAGTTAYLASPASSSGTSANLYTVDLATGGATLLGSIGNSGDNILVQGLAILQPEFAASVNPNATNITFSVTGGTNLTLSWPGSHIGWVLQSQTNSRSIGISNNWLDIVGSEWMTATNFPINAANPTVFHRLRKP